MGNRLLLLFVSFSAESVAPCVLLHRVILDCLAPYPSLLSRTLLALSHSQLQLRPVRVVEINPPYTPASRQIGG